MSKLLLIDGNSIMNRGYFALPKELTTGDGIHTNAILGFLNIFFRVYEEEKPSHIAVAFDVHAPTFRHKMFEDYKGTRHGMDDELREQFPIIKDVLGLMGITCMEKAGYEADDLIGTMSREGIKEGMEVTILSGDRDLLQLATDTVLVRIPKTKAGKTTVENYHAADVEAEYGVTPLEFIEMKGLMGDTSDNIPGVQGIGPKTASGIIQKYHSIEEALKHIDEIKPDKARKNLDESRDIALFSRDLATIKLDCEMDKKASETEVGENSIYSPEVYEKFKELELKSLLKRFDAVGEADKPKEKLEIKTVDMGLSDIVALIKKEKVSEIGLCPFMVDGALFGGAIAVGGEAGSASAADDMVYITREDSIAAIREMVPSGVTINMLSLKEYVGIFGFKEEDNLYDVGIAAYLAEPLKNSYSYDYLAEAYLGAEFEDEKTLIGKKEITLFSIDDEDVRKVLGYKAFTALKAAPVLREKLEELGETSLYETIEYPSLFVLYEMEKEGIRTERNVLVDYGNELDTKIASLTSKIYELAGEEFNINSPKQLGVILFEKLGLSGGKKTKSGYSTGADVLAKIKDSHEIIPLILEYRQLTKLKSTYVEGLLPCIKADGRIHSTFNQTVTATGRISSTEPNLQNLPTRTALGREIRKAFVPEDGYVFVDADYSQIELRVMAAISEDETLIEAFHEAKDIHAITASQVFGVGLDEVTPDLRRKAKAVNFGIIYGISSFGLGEDLGISRKEASGYIDKYFETYSKVKEYLNGKVDEAKKNGFVKTLYGRIRPIPELKSSNFMQRSFGERVAMNSPIQGTAADIIKLAMIKVYKELKARGLKSRLILQIHDELLIETHNDEVEEVKTLLKDCMQDAATLAVPLYVDVHTGDSLYEAK
ncbi:MAG: DNA polymerase I [Eubacterium sp.]|nr:DNA polymerase I [Eubacterium sp.]